MTSHQMDLADIFDAVRGVDDHDHFPSVDELGTLFEKLVAQSGGLLSRRRIGTSRLGEPLVVYTVGADDEAADHDHLVVGGVHPNEPIGFLTAWHLARALISDPGLRSRLRARWHIVPCIDPDGARLNETWYADPTDRNHYARWFYRPAPDEQVEWTFPFAYKDAYFDRVLPETLALMRLIDETRPSLYVSLHNGEFGGVYYYLSSDLPELISILHAVPAALELPLDTGEPESPHLRSYAPAVFATGTLADAYDYLEGLGLDAAAQIAGSSSTEYAASRYGTLGLVAELPFWAHPDADDATPTEESYDQLVQRTAADLASAGTLLAGMLADAEPHLGISSPFLRASQAFVPMLSDIAATDLARSGRGEQDRPATVSERFGREDLVRCFRLRYGGMLLRALDVECSAGTAPLAVRHLRDQLDETYARWQQDAAAETGQAWTIPIARLVGVQYGAILGAASVLAGGSG